jgi:hypothetical protein
VVADNAKVAADPWGDPDEILDKFLSRWVRLAESTSRVVPMPSISRWVGNYQTDDDGIGWLNMAGGASFSASRSEQGGGGAGLCAVPRRGCILAVFDIGRTATLPSAPSFPNAPAIAAALE